jgi:hypothetical protein
MPGTRRPAALILVGAAAVCATAISGATAAAGTHAASAVTAGWGTATVLPGTAALNKDHYAAVKSVSCAPAGNCAAGGFYTTLINNLPRERPFVASETNGTWGKAIEVPGIAALSIKFDALVTSVSCAPAGNCVAAGDYRQSSGGEQGFVVSQAGGTWGTAEDVTRALLVDSVYITSLSCGAAGDCSAGGYYRVGSTQQAFVVSEANGTWGAAEEVPGTVALNHGRNAAITSVSCASAGDCSAGGYYNNRFGRHQAFVVSQAGGTWGAAEEVPGTAAVNVDGAQITSVSCAAAGNCGAGGFYTDGSNNEHTFVVSQAGGTWGTTRGGTRHRRRRHGQLRVVPFGGHLHRRWQLWHPLGGVRSP